MAQTVSNVRCVCLLDEQNMYERQFDERQPNSDIMSYPHSPASDSSSTSSSTITRHTNIRAPSPPIRETSHPVLEHHYGRLRQQIAEGHLFPIHNITYSHSDRVAPHIDHPVEYCYAWFTVCRVLTVVGGRNIEERVCVSGFVVFLEVLLVDELRVCYFEVISTIC